MTAQRTSRDQSAHYPDLAGKVAVVTGGSRGIGAATARALAANAAVVAVVGRDRSAIDTTVAAITASAGQAIGLVCDCTNQEDLGQLRQTVVDRLGPPDILIPFAGGAGAPVSTANETAAHWRAVLESDLTATFLTVAAFLPDLLERRSGVILTMSSAAARQPAGSSAAYAAAKAGIIAFSRHLAVEVAPAGIRVNCMAPAAVENDKMRAGLSPDGRAALAASFPLARIGHPDDIAAAALFLTSSASAWITGITLDIAGGKTLI